MSKLRIIILDDEAEALDLLSGLLTATGKVDIIKMLQDPLKLESSIAALNPDAVFTDIQMPNYNGLEILKNLREYRPKLPVVYVSAHKKFALEAAKNNPFSYLLKPVNRIELNHTLDHIIDYIKSSENEKAEKKEKIKLPIKDGLIYVHYDEIFSLTAEGNYTSIKLTNGEIHLSSYNLGRLHEQLNDSFLRINRQTVVNSDYLKEVNRRKKYCIVKVQDIEEKLEVSNSFLKSINKEL